MSNVEVIKKNLNTGNETVVYQYQRFIYNIQCCVSLHLKAFKNSRALAYRKTSQEFLLNVDCARDYRQPYNDY